VSVQRRFSRRRVPHPSCRQRGPGLLLGGTGLERRGLSLRSHLIGRGGRARPAARDLQFAGPDRQMVFLELKRRGGRLSESQAAMKRHLEGCGFPYLCTDSVDVAIEWLKGWGVLRSGIHVQ
jgi:hypothetical protein